MQKALFGVLLVAVPAILTGRTLLDHHGQEAIENDTAVYEFHFRISENGSRMIMDLNSELDQGELNVWFGGAGFQVIGNYTGEKAFRYERVVFGPLNSTEPVFVKVTARNASGKWQLRFTEAPRNRSLVSLFVSGCLVVLLTIAISLWWKKRLSTPWRWLFVGAGVWVVGVVFKFVVAWLANTPVLTALDQSLGNTPYLILGSAYIGLLTGIFEIGMTAVFAFLVKRMWESPQNALGVALGAGLFEALLIGFSSIGSFVMVVTGSVSSDAITGALAQAAATTPLLWLLSSVERLIAILCHTSSRLLVFFAIAHRKQRYFWAGFFILTAIDAIAGYFHLAGLLNRISTWWIELLLLPFAIVSIPVIWWCYRKWRGSKHN